MCKEEEEEKKKKKKALYLAQKKNLFLIYTSYSYHDAIKIM